MTPRHGIHRLWAVGTGILILDVVLLLIVRVVPSGYDSWIYVSRVFSGLLHGEPLWIASYATADVPVPNSALVCLVAALGEVVSFEIAGKLVLAFLVVSLPLGVLAANRALHGGDGRTLALLAIPLAMGWQTFLSQNCTLGLVIVMWGLAYYGWRRESLGPRDVVLLAVLMVCVFFCHALSFMTAVAVCFGVGLCEPFPIRKRGLFLGCLLAPSAALVVWYSLGHYPDLSRHGTWSLYTILQNFLKPLVLFMRVDGVASPVPPAFGNLPWFCLFGFLILWTLRSGLLKRNLDLRFMVPVAFCLICMLTFPDPLLGVDQPGTRFGLPLTVFGALLLGRIPVKTSWSAILLAIAFLVTLYDVSLFRRFDERSAELVQDLDSTTQARRAVYVIALDWPRVTGFSERVSAYGGGLAGIPQLYAARHDLAIEIPETSPVVMKEHLRAMYPVPSGAEIEAWKSSILSSSRLLLHFREILVVGTSLQAKETTQFLVDSGWRSVVSRNAWTILRSPAWQKGHE
jgi:hypothetical protein